MSIATEIARLQDAKSDLKTSIEGKGVTVPAATKIDGYAALVDLIQQGGGGHTGTVDTAGLQALGWDSDDIQWLQDHVWWDAEDDAEWAVTEANKAFGPNGATPLTWGTRGTIQYNSDVRYLPKLTPTGTSWGSIFNSYVHLVAIPTHGWDTSNVTSFSACFYNCVSLRSMGDISRWVTSTATAVSQMFGQCFSLEEIDVSHWDTSNVTNFQQMFHVCKKLKYVDISSWSFTKATNAMMMFSSCLSLEAVKLPASINAPVLTDMSNMFVSCNSLKEMNLNITAATLSTMRSFLSQCRSLQSAKLIVASTTLSNIIELTVYASTVKEVDISGIDTTGCDQAGVGTSFASSPVGYINTATTIKLGANFFNGSFTTLYMQGSNSWSRDSIYESLYTNQTSRDSNSNAVTVKLATQAYDRLSAQDISDIATKNITLTRG